MNVLCSVVFVLFPRVLFPGLLSAQLVFCDTFEGGEVSPNGGSLLPFFCKVGIVLAEEVLAANAPSELKAAVAELSFSRWVVQGSL